MDCPSIGSGLLFQKKSTKEQPLGIALKGFLETHLGVCMGK
ncbi:MAG: hypothetical protein US48_C0019G0007 [Candidatus Levybacteria bacterium GW2011_GWA2_37_36]|nr:MAG: hypothetical protein US48_C0019G0007 [Candidatus Levybacteria bacterium GW2011_GWA2_37_36]